MIENDGYKISEGTRLKKRDETIAYIRGSLYTVNARNSTASV